MTKIPEVKKNDDLDSWLDRNYDAIENLFCEANYDEFIAYREALYIHAKVEVAKTASPHICDLCNEPIVENAEDERSTEESYIDDDGITRYIHYGCGEEEQERQSDPATKDN